MHSSDVTVDFETRQTACPVCGAALSEKYIPYINSWIKEKCSCVRQKEQEEQARKKEAEKRLRIQENKRLSGIKPLYRGCTFDNYIAGEKTAAAKRLAQHYAQKFGDVSKEGKGLIFIGNTGSGKTHLAAAIANSLLEQGVKVRFISFSNLMQEITGARDFGATENGLVKSLQKCRLLVIDDIGVTPATEKACAVLYTILDERINTFMPTVLTSNIADLSEIKSKFNEQIYDRIKGSCYVARVAAQSRRDVNS